MRNSSQPRLHQCLLHVASLIGQLERARRDLVTPRSPLVGREELVGIGRRQGCRLRGVRGDDRERSLVDANKLSCDKRFYNYWEPRDGDEPLPPPSPPRFTLVQKLPSLNPGQAVYYYAIAIILYVRSAMQPLFAETRYLVNRCKMWCFS